MNWKEVILETAKKHDLFQNEIAKLIGIAPSTLSSLINGINKDPSYSTGMALLKLRDSESVQQFKGEK